MNNEEKILAMLAEHSEILIKQGETLAKHGEALEKHSAILEKHSEILGRHSEILEKHSEMLEKLTEKVDELDARSLRTAILLENEVARDIRLVYEGQALLKEKMDSLAPAKRVASVEDDVAMLKDVVKLMRLEINELKQAQ